MSYKFNKNLQLLKLHKKPLNFSIMCKYIVHPFIIFFFYNKLTYPRLGYLIGKKKIKYAYQRNLIKRIIKEYFRINKKNLNNIDIIISITNLINCNKFTKLDINININKIFNFLRKIN